MRSPLFATKPLGLLLQEAQETGERSLKRSLGPYQLVALGVGAIIGAGIIYFGYSRHHSRIRGAAAR